MTLVSYNLSVPASRERSDFLNAPFDPLAFEEVLERIRTIDETSPFKYIVTPNVDHVVRLNRDSSLREYYSKAWLSLCDSAPISAFALLLWVDLPIVTGSDLTEAMFREVIRDGDRVTLIVANQQVADRAMQTFRPVILIVARARPTPIRVPIRPPVRSSTMITATTAAAPVAAPVAAALVRQCCARPRQHTGEDKLAEDDKAEDMLDHSSIFDPRRHDPGRPLNEKDISSARVPAEKSFEA